MCESIERIRTRQVCLDIQIRRCMDTLSYYGFNGMHREAEITKRELAELISQFGRIQRDYGMMLIDSGMQIGRDIGW